MTKLNGGPVSGGRRENSVLYNSSTDTKVKLIYIQKTYINGLIFDGLTISGSIAQARN